MTWNTQSRTLEIVSDAIPEHCGKKIFEPVRCKGTDKLGRLFDYRIDVQTIEANGLHVNDMDRLVDVSKLVGKRLTVKIAIEGSGTQESDEQNIGADVRVITGVIAEVKCVGADDRRMFYRLRLRCLLWLASLNRDNRHFRDRTVREISDEILKKYPFSVRWNLIGAGNGSRNYPKRDYQRQFWESDFSCLNRLWQEWGITFYWDDDTLVLMDNAGYPAHGPACKTVRYLERGGQRIDEEHIHKLEYSRGLTTGKVAGIDYDYTRATNRQFKRRISNHRDAAHDNAEEYTWLDYAQPQQGAMGLNAEPNDYEFEGDHLARVRVDAHRNKSLVIKATGNLRGVMTGHQLTVAGHPFAPVNRKYIVTGTKIEIVNNDSVTQGGTLQREYTCRTKFTAIPNDHYYRTPQKAKKPRAFAEKAVVTGHDKKGVHTDAMARIRVKFIWDRVSQADEEASCWIPLMQVWQGQRYGMNFVPRVGDHVYIGFLNMDPDRPFILGSHTTDRNEAPWDLYANHALSGWRSQDLDGYGKGSNTVVTDDTPGQLQVQVTSDHANSRFVAGCNVRIDGNTGRSQARGEGIEIATDANAVMRANRGMLITTEARDGATAPMKDMGETIARLDEARTLHDRLAGEAQANGAQDSGGDQKAVASAIRAQNRALAGKAGAGKFPEFAQPHVTLASPAGIESTTASSTHVASGEHLAMTSGADVAIAAGGSFFGTFGNKLRMTVQKAGMRLVAVSGDIDLRALKDSINLLARLNVTVTAEKITISAKQEVEIRGGGSFTRWSNGKIYHGTPGQFEIHSAGRLFTGPDSASPPTLPESTPGQQELHFSLGALANGAAHRYVEEPYELYQGNALIDSGVTDSYGRVVVKDHQPETTEYCVKLCYGGQFRLKVKDALDADADHIDQRSNRGDRAV
ncbi:type VI secretion system Vgr family protein [Paraburkholderia xenovorans]